VTSALVLDEFLSVPELEAAQAHLAAHLAELEHGLIVDPARSAGTVRRDVRSVRVLRETGAAGAVVAHRVRALLPWVLERLGEPPLEPGRVETEFSVSTEGDFFAAHRDNAGARVRRHASRELTFVLFVHFEPKAFAGGELRIFPGDRPDEDGAVTVEPAQDRIVFFPSRLLHAVAPVRGAAPGLGGSRLALTGWVHGR
jgi:Rps23 Pro-64 3,4-dihydroxylase Tpa1-like proline 4-hydroxylase